MKNIYNNNFISKQMLNKFLCCYPGKLHINNSHYVTGKDLIFFSKLMCVENELTNITGCCNNLCCNIKSLFKRWYIFLSKYCFFIKIMLYFLIVNDIIL